MTNWNYNASAGLSNSTRGTLGCIIKESKRIWKVMSYQLEWNRQAGNTYEFKKYDLDTIMCDTRK